MACGEETTRPAGKSIVIYYCPLNVSITLFLLIFPFDKPSLGFFFRLSAKEWALYLPLGHESLADSDSFLSTYNCHVIVHIIAALMY